MPLLAGIRMLIGPVEKIGFCLLGLTICSSIHFHRRKKRRTQKMLTCLIDRGQLSAMPENRRCVAPCLRSQGTPPNSPWPASAGSTQMRSSSLVERTPRWVTSCHYMFIGHNSLMSARRVPVYRAARDYEKANIQSAVC